MIGATAHDHQLSLLPEVELYPAEVEVFRKPEKLTPSQWAEKYRVVTDGPWKGPWRNENTPYLVEPMDTWARRGVREVVVVAITQSGKTQLVYNCWGYGVDQRQATSLVTMADKETAHNVSRDRFQPIIQDSPKLSRLKTGRSEDLGLERLRLLGSLTYLAWASSAARLQTMPIEHCYGDEVALYKSWSGKGVTDPVSMLRGRITTFRHTGKLLLVSSVYQDSDPHWQAFLACQEKRAFALKCPSCGRLQLPGRQGLRWDESVTDANRLQAENLVWYECEHCGQPWSDAELRKATLAGQYIPVIWDPESRWFLPSEPSRDPVRVGFWFNAFASPFVPLGEIGAWALRGKDNPQDEHDFCHRYLAVPYHDERAAREEDFILALCDERQPGVIPSQAVALTVGVDVQERVLYYAVRAWAPGPDEESWLIRAGVVQSFHGLAQVLFNQVYQDTEGNQRFLDYGLIDSPYRRREVLSFAWEHAPLRPSLGRDKMTALVRLAKADDQYPGLLRHDVNVTAFKDALDRKLKIPPADPGAFHLHSNLDPDGNPLLLVDYAKQLCAEAPDDNGLWRQINNRPNHYLDCEVLNLVCAHMLEIRFLDPDPEPETTPSPTPANAPERSARW